MAETQARIGYGTLFKYGDGASPEVFTTVAEVYEISGPSLSREIPDATHMESPDGYREFLGGLKDGGEVTIEANFLPAHASQNASTGVISFFDAGERRNYQIVWPTSPTTSWQFAAVVQSVEPAAPVDDKLNLSVTFKLSGKPAFL